MKKQSYSVTLVGPGRGHNISILLSNFSNQNIFTINYLGSFKHEQKSFTHINFFNYGNNYRIIQWLKRIFFILIIPKCEILYIQDGIVPYDYKLLKAFKKLDKIIYNVWSEYNIPEPKAKGESFKKRILEDADIIQCNWYGTAERIKRFYPYYIAKTVVLSWGLPKDFFKDIKVDVLHSFTIDFTEKIKKYKHKFLNMRSIADYNAIEELLEAAKILKERNIETFRECLFVFWPGNNVAEKQRNYITEFIDRHDLEDNVWYVEHPFLPNDDIKYIINSFNYIINLVKHDQLSTSVTEAMFLNKELVCSDIPAYRYLNSKYDLCLPLIELTPSSIVSYILDKITNQISSTSKEILLKRKLFVTNTFNSNKFISEFENLIHKIIVK